MMKRSDSNQLIARIKQALEPAGFDIVQPFNIRQYNDFAQENPRLPRFPDFDRKDALALLIGNSKAAWKPFLDDYHSRFADGVAPDNPFDDYAERVVSLALESSSIHYKLRFGHEGGDEFVSLLHACEASQFAKISPANLAIHPDYGLWFGLRAVAVFDCPPLDKVPKNWITPCETCSAPCKQISEALMAKHNGDWMACTWQERVTVRDSCPVGHSARYSDAQIHYHYSKDKSALIQTDEN